MTIFEIVLTCVMAALAIGFIVFYAIKAAKNNYISKVYETITTAMKKAEEIGGTGEEKKAYVLGEVKKLCKELSIPYDFIATLVGKVIENVIKGYNSMTK